jgi:uncharacterized membrane protein
MSSDNAAAPIDRPLFSATLTPHRSLSPAGFLIFMAVVGAGSFFAGLSFLLHGAWPVFGFFGLDVAAVYFAFRLNYRSARAYEEVVMTYDRLLVRQVAASGRTREFAFNPYWTRLVVDKHPEWGVTRLVLASRGQELQIGAFLNPDDRASFNKALSAALAAARRGEGLETAGEAV